MKLLAILLWRWPLTLLALGALLGAAPAWAEKVIWKYDSLEPDMATLANGLANHPVYAHMGFVSGEAYGQIYKPKPEDYPVKILSVELVMTQPKKIAVPQQTDVTIEIWNGDGVGPAPVGSKPLWSISTKDFAAGPQIGVPVKGNYGMVYDFDWSKPENHPPPITKGNIWVVIRYQENASDLSEYWDKLECMKQQISGIELGCGCQHLAAISDQVTTPGANVVHIVWPLGTCSGAKQWKFIEQIAKDGVQMKGDFLLRLGVEGNAAPPPEDLGSTQPDAGSSDAGPTDAGSKPDAGTTDLVQDSAAVPVQAPTIDAVTPQSGPFGKAIQIDVYGKGFQVGLTAKLGTEAIAVDAKSVTATSFSATVIGLAAGSYDLVVKNPDGQVGFKTSAFKVEAAVTPDTSSQPDAGTAEVTVADTAAEVSADTAAAPFSVEAVTPDCIAAAAASDTVITVLGSGFAEGLVLKLDSTELVGVEVKSGSKATALVPKGLSAGTRTLYAVQGGATKVLANAVTIGACGKTAAPVAGNNAEGCSANRRSSSGSWALLTLACAALVALRRRRFLGVSLR